MIHSNHIRLGNLVIHSTTKKVMGATFLCSGKSYYEAIPLTEEWVKELGFVQLEMPWKDGQIKFDEFKLGPLTIAEVAGGTKQWQVAFNNHWLMLFISNVHELQNVYFTFTGEELKQK